MAITTQHSSYCLCLGYLLGTIFMAKQSFPVALLVVFLPFKLKSFIYNKIFGYEISKEARIGFSFINVDILSMSSSSSIGNFNFIANLDCVQIGSFSSIGAFNWITGFPTRTNSKHFSHQPNRCSKLSIGRHSAITKHHHIDCTSTVTIGNFTTIAGYYSQFLTHSVDIHEARQDSYTINIGSYCFVGTNCILLGKTLLPDFTVLGAKSLVARAMPDQYALYAGSPAKKIKPLAKSANYFTREKGFIY